MDRRDFEDIDRFLASVGKTSLYAYYGVDLYALPQDVENAIRKRRNWAQGQQSNPKYKAEALYLIKNNALLRRALLEEADDYRAHAADGSSGRNLDVLTLYIKSAVANGVLTQASEMAIRHQGKQLGLAENVVEDRIDAVLQEIGATRAVAEADADGLDGAGLDHYMLLDVPETASLEQIEAAYRKRYRWARSLKDLNRSTEVLHALDSAWRVLRDPGKRERYDALRAELQDMTDEVELQAARLLGLLATSGLDSDGSTNPPAQRLPIDEPSVPSALPPIDMPGVSRGADAAVDAPPVAPVAERFLHPRTEDVVEPRVRTPRLEVGGPDLVRIRVDATTAQHRLVLKNVGHGRMPGRVTSDRDWLTVPNPRLDPNAMSQAITVLVEPASLPWGLSTGSVTVHTEHGEKRTITFEVRRNSLWRYAMLGGVALAGVTVILAGIAAWDAYVPAPETAEIQLFVDPPADRIFVDDVGVAQGSAATIVAPSADVPFRLRIEADGFAAHEELVNLRNHQRLVRRVSLALDDAMDWAPPASPPRPLSTDEVTRITDAASRMAACVGPSGGEADYELAVTTEGRIRSVTLTDATFETERALPCIRRSFRSLRLDPSTEWARFRGRLATSAQVTSAGAGAAEPVLDAAVVAPPAGAPPVPPVGPSDVAPAGAGEGAP